MSKRGEPPIACTLQGGSYQERLAWIAELAGDGLSGVTRDDLRLELRYAADVASRVREMVRKEQVCCAFLDFDLTETSGEVRLTITAPESAREIADALFEQFVPSDEPYSTALALNPGTRGASVASRRRRAIVARQHRCPDDPRAHGTQSHVACGRSSQKNTRNPAGLCADAQARPLIKNGFVQASLSNVPGARTDTADVPCAG